MAVRSEVCARLANSPGALASVFEALLDARVAVDAWHLGSDASLRVMCDNPLLAADVLAQHQPVTARDVMTATVGARDLGRLLRRCARAGVNLDYVYAGQGDGRGSVLVVLGVADAARTSAQLGL